MKWNGGEMGRSWIVRGHSPIPSIQQISSYFILCYVTLFLTNCASVSEQSDLLKLSHLDSGIVDLAGQETNNIYDPLNLLKQGEAYGEKGDHVLAADAYNRFLKLYPFHRLASSAQYALAMSYMHQITAIDRDPTPIEQAKAAFEKILTHYPDTVYAAEAAARIEILTKQLVEYQFVIGYSYYKRAVYPAAAARFERVLEKSSSGELTEKTLYYLGQSYAKSGHHEEAKQVFARLIADYPDSSYLRHNKFFDWIRRRENDNMAKPF